MNVSDILEPDGVLDMEACALYLTQHGQFGGDYHYLKGETFNLLQALLKKVPHLPQAKDLFVRMYHSLRADGNLRSLLESMASHDPAAVREWLLSSRAGANVTTRVNILQDAKRYLPDDALQDYLSGSWERISAKGFSKSFSPATDEIPYLMAAALELQTSQEPTLRTLSDLLQQGCFVATYRLESEATTTGATYNTVQAFQLAEQMNPPIDAGTLLDLAGHRLKGETLVSSALDYVIDVVQANRENVDTRLARDVLNEVLRRENIHTSGFLYYTGYVRLHELTADNPEWADAHSAIHDRVLDYISTAPVGTEGRVQAHVPWRHRYVWESCPSLVQAMLHRAVEHTHDSNHQKMLRSFLFPLRGEASHPFTEVHYLRTSGYAPMILGMCTSDEIVQIFSSELERTLGAMDYKIKNSAEQDRLLRDSALLQLDGLTWLLNTPYTGQDELREKLASSSLLPRLVLTYCLAGSLVKDKDSTLYMRGTLPNLQFHPFPLLRAVYPEHRALLQATQKQMLAQPVSTMREGISEVFGQLFDTFAKVYMAEHVQVVNIREMSELLDVHPIAGFQSMWEKSAPVEMPNLDMAIFDFGSV